MLLKCVYCRRDKKKCISEGKGWPEKCKHCIKSRFPCSERVHTKDYTASVIIPQTLAPKLQFREVVEIIRDFDCTLYLLAGLLDYSDHHICPPITEIDFQALGMLYSKPERLQSAFVVEGDYCFPKTRDDLNRNFRVFNTTKIFCKFNLEKELKKLREEAELVVEYYNSKQRYTEVSVLCDLMMASPDSYTTKALRERNTNRMLERYLPTITLNEKQRGQLFLHIKASTLPSDSIPVCLPTLHDFLEAEKTLSDLENRLEDTYSCDWVPIWRNSSVLYDKIDPIWHRALFLGDRDPTLLEGRWGIFPENLLGESYAHIALRHGLSYLVTQLPLEEMSYSQVPYYGNFDIRGMDTLTAYILYGLRQGLYGRDGSPCPKISINNTEHRNGCFFSVDEVSGLARIRRNLPDLETQDWVLLRPYQLAALLGDPMIIDQFDLTLSPDLELLLTVGQTPVDTNPLCSKNLELYRYLRNAIPVIDLGDLHPVTLSALSGYLHITEGILTRYPGLEKPQYEGGALESLVIIAFKIQEPSLLDLLSVPIKTLVNVDILIGLSSYAANFANPTLFDKWMKLTWFHPARETWRQEMGTRMAADLKESSNKADIEPIVIRAPLIVRCLLWQKVLSVLLARYRSEVNGDRKGQIWRFWEILQTMAESKSFLEACQCVRCEREWRDFHTTFGVWQDMFRYTGDYDLLMEYDDEEFL